MGTYLVFFVGGIAGSLHCVGMCGIFPLTIGGGAGRGKFLRQALYNLGTVNSLVFIGACSGALGAAVVSAGPVQWVERALAVVAGLFMLMVGLEMLGVLRQVTGRWAILLQGPIWRILSTAMRSRSYASPLVLGVLNPFLPCQLVYAFAAHAASTASIGQGMLTMLAFGLGTVPVMLALGTIRSVATPALRARLSTASAVLVIAFGIVTLMRGLDLLPHAIGHHH